MKKQLLKKLYAFIVTAMMFSASANAQIVYTDVIPDNELGCMGVGSCSDSVNVDLNNDGSMDFILIFNRIYLGTCPPVGFLIYKNNAGVSTIGANSFYGIISSNPSAFNYGDTIDSNIIWSKGSDTLGNYSHPTCNSSYNNAGNWLSTTTDQYLPVKISIANNNYFGWIRMQMIMHTYQQGPGSTVGFVLRDYAYNSTPNQFILAGDTGTTGIIETIASSINLFPNPATDKLTIALGSNNRKVVVTIADITGKIIYSTTATETQKLEVNTKDFASGIYVAQIQSAEFIATNKLVIEK